MNHKTQVENQYDYKVNAETRTANVTFNESLLHTVDSNGSHVV